MGDTDTSLRFYRDTLGLTVVGRSENWGPEQERLNNVPGARLRITTLRAPAGPGIELLEYLTPRDGRPYPVNARANDLVHWQTLLIVKEAEPVARALRAGQFAFVSPGTIALGKSDSGFQEGFLLRDPDGHTMQFRAP